MKILLVDLKNFPPARTEELLSTLPSARREEILRFLKAEDRARSAVGEAAVRLTLAETAGVPLSSLKIARRERGKPFLEGSDLHFNLSHSGEMVACAFDCSPVGIDVEEVTPFDYSAVAKRCFSQREREEIARASRPLAQFYLFWTARESAVKKSGGGLEDLRGLSVRDGRALFNGVPSSDRIASYAVLKGSLQPAEGLREGGYALSVCREGEDETFTAEFCSAEELAARYLAACGPFSV